MTRAGRRPALLALALLLVGGRAFAQETQQFDHLKHQKVFPRCQACHVGAAVEGADFFPRATACDNCHDGTVEKTVTFTPPERKPTNLRFTHDAHAREVVERAGRDSALACLVCHGQKDAPWMQVERPIPERCFECHAIRGSHKEAPDTSCASCHLPLARAVGLTRARVAAFPKPPSHEARDFLGKGHGALAQPLRADGRRYAVAPSCATCHARDFCTECHVNAPEVAAIQALAPDPRATAIEVKLEPPASHKVGGFERTHGSASRSDAAYCATCHTKESCATCHRGAVAVNAELHAAGPGRAAGAQITRALPPWHTPRFVGQHGPTARATPSSCTSCHAKAECLDCHRPNPGAAGAYHPAGFLARHPAAAYGRQNDCSTCHNPAAFCATCHTQAGLRSHNGLFQGRYHDAGSTFLLSHGPAARFNIENCVTCHSERDCLACHSSQTRRFNPHGPGFDAERLRRKNPQTCAACHGQAIPGGN